MLLKSNTANMLPTGSPEERRAFRNKIHEELPGYVYFLLHEYVMPPELACPRNRYGITHFHHPELLAGLEELAPESKLDEIIQTVLFDSVCPSPWEGKSSDLEAHLRNSTRGFEISKLLSFQNACGTYLGRLAKRYEGQQRYNKRVKDGYNIWRIFPQS